MTEVVYVAQYSPSFKINLTVELDGKTIRKRVEFENKQCVLNTDDALEALFIKELDRLITVRSDIASQVQKVNMEAALKMAEQHKEMMKLQRGTMTGVTTASEHLKIAQARLMERDLKAGQALETQPDLQVTEQSDTPIPSPGLSVPNPPENQSSTESVFDKLTKNSK